MSFYDQDRALSALEVKVSELLTATADHSDPMLEPAVRQVLGMLREQRGMEAAFACELIDGKRIFQRAQPSEKAQFIDEQAEPLELAICQQVLRATVPSGCYLSAPVMLANGMFYGSLYSYSFNPDPALEARDIQRLEGAAQMMAQLINERSRAGTAAVRGNRLPDSGRIAAAS